MATQAEYKLGLTASSAEFIRDSLLQDVETLRRDLRQLTKQHEQTGEAITRLSRHIEELLVGVTLDVLDTTVRANAATTISVVDEAVHSSP